MHTKHKDWMKILAENVRQFTRDRNWEQYHTPKNLSMSIAIESAELMELFQWAGQEAPEEIRKDPDLMQQIEEEMADVLLYLVSLSNVLGVDLEGATQRKVEKNGEKYPKSLFATPDGKNWREVL